jgi:4-hydroxybenzoyl-CoA thioesterase
MAAYVTTRAVRFGDCDPAGIAYYPRCLDLLNGVVEDWFTSLGHPWTDLVVRRRMGVPTVHLEVDFRAPARLGDRLEFTLVVERVGTSSLRLAHRVCCGDTLLWQTSQVLVSASLADHRALAWPDDLRVAFERCLETSHAHDPAA